MNRIFALASLFVKLGWSNTRSSPSASHRRAGEKWMRQLQSACSVMDVRIRSVKEAAEKQVAIQKVGLTEVMKGETQLKRATEALLQVMERVDCMVEDINMELENSAT
ncbi:uncharacterized protein [Fopius arisanus]|uniref:Xirp2 protein n=1 Tax=Fopius arisanus TaxID=64838 RepID=A0A0C9Q628_9HYME|nr:PREDICTED: uncharacterized protein LOC105272901 [Fopius arisanus]XP_011313434.1 PREDICTED: uncharacterized protein LOC105272901 [Fopius arisanus]